MNAEKSKRSLFEISFLVFGLLLFAGCKKSPIDRVTDASNGGATGNFTKAQNFVIFSSELVSGGGAFEYPGSEGQSLTFNDQSNPISHRSIRYSWTGEPVSNPGSSPNPEHTFAGFDLMHTPTLATYSATPGRDLSQAGYTKATFYARGSLSTNTMVKVEVAAAGAGTAPCLMLSADGTDTDPNSPTCTPSQMTSSWRAYTIPVSNFSSIKDYFKATFVFIDPPIPAPGQGGVVYFDQIQYEP